MKNFLKRFLKKLGYKLSRNPKELLLDNDPLIAVKSKSGNDGIILFDIGANIGQTIDKMRSSFSNATIYSFEPSKNSFKKLESKYLQEKNIRIYNTAIGSEKGKLNFNQYTWSAMDSFLTRSYGTTEIADSYFVNITTVDDFCQENNISYINLLKTDTEGYELNVLKGASKTFDEKKIQFVLVEIFFNENYIGQSSFGDIWNYLIEKEFELVRFYDVTYTNEGIASKTDALFICRNFIK